MESKNVLGTPLRRCCLNPATGFHRNGRCDADPADTGRHWLCAQMTDEFLDFSRGRGNDLRSASAEYHFPGLIAGDRWCMGVRRWLEARDAGVAPPVVLESTHEAVLGIVSLEDLRPFAAEL